MECRGWLLGALHTPSSQFLARRPTVNNRRSSTKARPSSSSSSKLFSRSSLGRSCGSQGEERSPWPGVNGVSDKKRGNSRRGMWWFLGGKLSYARMVKIGVHLLQCHTKLQSFLLFQRRGGKYLSWNRSNFSGTSTIQWSIGGPVLFLPTTPCVAHHTRAQLNALDQI